MATLAAPVLSGFASSPKLVFSPFQVLVAASKATGLLSMYPAVRLFTLNFKAWSSVVPKKFTAGSVPAFPAKLHPFKAFHLLLLLS